MDPIFRWNGEHFEFVHRWRLFDSRSYYLGWVDEGEVWRRDGTYLGELVDGCYVLRRRNAKPRSPRVPIEIRLRLLRRRRGPISRSRSPERDGRMA